MNKLRNFRNVLENPVRSDQFNAFRAFQAPFSSFQALLSLQSLIVALRPKSAHARKTQKKKGSGNIFGVNLRAFQSGEKWHFSGLIIKIFRVRD
jgi:hypothetical protein